MNDWKMRLAAEFLREYAERLGNDGCNDYVPPDYVPTEELERLCGEANGDPDEPIMENPFNFMVAEMLAWAIDRELESKR